MKINQHTKIIELIRHNEAVVNAIAELRPAFRKLKNPVLRKILSSRVNIYQASKLGGCTVNEFFKSIEAFGFEIENESSNSITNNETPFDIHPKKIIDLDIDNFLNSQKDPFPIIFMELRKSKPGEVICISSAFDPLPLKDLLAAKRVRFFSDQGEEGRILTYIEGGNIQSFRNSAIELTNQTFEKLWNDLNGEMEIIDVRDLEMPQPLVKIAMKLEDMEKGKILGVRHERKPAILLDRLEQEGLKAHMCQFNNEDFRLIIYT